MAERARSPFTLAAAALVASLAFVAAGCGGSSESAQEKWANDVCSPFVDWSNTMKQLANDAKSAIQSPSAEQRRPAARATRRAL